MKFTNLQLIEPLQRAVAEEGYDTPTPIQAQSIPPILKGRDVMGIAQTGTGKTAAFTLPMLQRLHESPTGTRQNSPRALILTPTRELAAQIGASIASYGKHLRISHTVIFGGVGQNPQVKALRRGVDIVVATPGRLLDLMQQGHILLDKVEIFVLDEADRMLDMGFIHDVRRVTKKIPNKRQSLFFSATMSPQVDKLAKSMLTDPLKYEVTPQATTVEKIDQRILFVDRKDKSDLLLHLLNEEHLDKVLVFTKTKRRANKVAKFLSKNGVQSAAIHGNKSQTARTKALAGFHDGKTHVLVATDIAARGIDVDDISHVIQYDLPDDTENYVHRIGRTARAGAEGVAYSFVAAEDKHLLKDVQKLIGAEIANRDHRFHSHKAWQAPAVKPKKRRGRRRRRRR